MGLCTAIQRVYPTIRVVACIEPFSDAAVDLIVQTTPLGMQGVNEGKCPLPSMDWVSPHHVVVDIVYKPAITAFMSAAISRGAKVLGGAGMLAGQGILAYRLFTGKDIPYRIMKDALE